MLDTMEKTAKREWIVFENRGQEIFGVFHRPLKVKNEMPIVVIHHGFASSKQGSNRCYVLLADALASKGVAALRFDFRGSGDSEGYIADLTFDDLVSDAICVHEEIKKIGGIDFERLGLFGASLGGSLAILATEVHQMTKALVLWAPVASGQLWYYDFVKRAEKSGVDPEKALASYRGVQLNQVFREQFGQMQAAQVLSEHPEIPFLHMHGNDDTMISILHQEAFRKACKHHATAQFKTYPECEHSLGFAPIFPSVMQETIDWFEKHLR